MRVLPRLSVLLLGLLAAAIVQAQAGKIYQWKDANGVTHYADSPPPDQPAKDRRIDNRGEPAVAAAPADQPAENPQCATARQNLQLLSSNVSVQQDTDGDGKPDLTLDETARANQKALAEAAVKAYCTAPTPVAGQ